VNKTKLKDLYNSGDEEEDGMPTFEPFQLVDDVNINAERL